VTYWDHTKFGKWSLSWEGLYTAVEIVPKNSYFVQSLQGEISKRSQCKIFEDVLSYHEDVGLMI
jgi:hypothetical protein